MISPTRQILAFALLSLFATAWPCAQAQDAVVPCRRFWRQTECVAVPLAMPAEDAQAKQFGSPSSAMSKIYLTRPGTMAPKQKSDIFVDGKWIGSLAPMTYLVIETSPGAHVIAAHMRQEQQEQQDFSMSLNVAGEKNTYIQEQLHQLFNTEKIVFEIVDQKTGQTDVLKSRLIKTATNASSGRPPSP